MYTQNDILFAQVSSPEKLAPEELDAYLEFGWFRMGQTIFTTNFLHFKDQFYSAIWLRIVLSDFVHGKTEQKLTRQNSIFRKEIRRAVIDEEKENLFATYRKSVSFEASASLRMLMFGKSDRAIYNTYEVSVYDGAKLIAAGFFDLGKTSAEGITCFYDPAYRKYSLGKYLIFQKINFCQELGLRYFYPGYFVPGYSFFDYKLDIGREALQYLQLHSGHWLPIATFTPEDAPIRVMSERLNALSVILKNIAIDNTLWWYEFFDVNLHPDLQGAKLFDFPIFLQCTGLSNDAINPIIVYDVRDSHYHILECRSIWISNAPHKEGIYAANLLAAERVLFSASFVDEICAVFTRG